MPSEYKTQLGRGDCLVFSRDGDEMGWVCSLGEYRGAIDLSIGAERGVEIERPDGGVSHCSATVRLDTDHHVEFRQADLTVRLTFASRQIVVSAPRDVQIDKEQAA